MNNQTFSVFPKPKIMKFFVVNFYKLSLFLQEKLHSAHVKDEDTDYLKG